MTDIDLTPDLDRFVRSQVDAGRFRDLSDVIAAGLRLLEEAIATQTGHRDHLLASIAAAFDDPNPGVAVAVAFDRLEGRHARRVSNGGQP
ncbi:type II toxin-antitoxin system ParD family antitoxin [Methylobacterium sp. J-088]|uniref:type II toxin-antitoxin system ParD family antitoxin n=1 Tax=Methylobacterium sp. J-088 TaxID=2836664 RepID=UPI001FBB45E6|nr:type II toxin-antitoxin system ParD family antitoxin [Methylobacterium sp. J-088]MCJ2063753.1 type II toxin-antitoxin system ParD family antitoxin [Methylobacterium sp. J-088]